MDSKEEQVTSPNPGIQLRLTAFGRRAVLAAAAIVALNALLAALVPQLAALFVLAPFALLAGVVGVRGIRFEAVSHHIDGYLGTACLFTLTLPVEETDNVLVVQKDNLTGFHNRARFRKLLQEHLEAADQRAPVSLLLMDIDNFKPINDTYGYLEGDRYLEELAGHLRHQMRGALALGRLGGDEFGVLLRADYEQAKKAAQHLIDHLNEHPSSLTGQPIGVSIGLATAKQDDQSADDLFQDADTCCYSAKHQGRGRAVSMKDFSEAAEKSGTDAMMVDFEARIENITKSMSAYILRRAKVMAEEYKHQADIDWLTGVYNKGYLQRVLTRELDKAAESKTTLSLLFIDLDDFSKVNNNHGYPTGDRTLTATVHTIRDHIRANDWIGRYGGEEFCVVMPGTDESAAAAVAERICDAIRENRVTSFEGGEITVTASIAALENRPGNTNAEQLFQDASRLVKTAKHSGKDRVVAGKGTQARVAEQAI
jgi:diguanylate cyclase (GGDEF)-like protein